MKRRMGAVWALFWLVTTAVPSSLSADGRAPPGPAHDPLFPEGFLAKQQLCIDAWADVVAEWVEATGGIHGTIEETRSRIASDRVSRLSRIFRGAWGVRQQGEDWFHVTDRLNAAIIEEVADGGLPQACGSYSWLHPLWVELPGAFADGAEEELRKEAPSAVGGSSRAFSRWILLKLLVRDS